MPLLTGAPKLANHNNDTLGSTIEGLLGWAANIEQLVLPLVSKLNPEIAVLIGEGTQFAEDVAGAVIPQATVNGTPAAPLPPVPAAAAVPGSTVTPIEPSGGFHKKDGAVAANAALSGLKLAPQA